MNRDQSTSDPEATESLQRFLRLSIVLEVTGLGRSTLYRMVAEHKFPAPVNLGTRAVGWRLPPVPRQPEPGARGREHR